MKLTKVRAQNLKGETFELDLTAITVLFGQNFRGKTARLDAIRLVLIGYIPELGKTPAATFELCSGRELVVDGEFDDGSKIYRRWYLKGNSVKTEVTLPPWMEKTSAGVLAVMLDSSAYFSLGATDQVRYVFENLILTGVQTIEDREAAAVAAARSHDWGADKIEPKAADAACDKLAVAIGADRRADECAEGFPGWTPQSHAEWLVNCVVKFGKTAKEHAIRMEKTVQGLSQLRASEIVKVDLAALDAERVKLTACIDEAQGTKARHFAAYEQGRANRSKRERLTTDVRGIPGFMDRRERLALSIDAKIHETSQLPATDEKALMALITDEADARSALREREREHREVNESIQRNETEKKGIDSKKQCPYCGASGEGWKALRFGEIDSAIAGMKTKRDQFMENKSMISVHLDTVSKRLQEARVARDRASLLAEELRALREQDSSLDRTLSVLQERQKELASLPADDTSAAAAVETAQTALNVKNDQLRELDDKRRTAMGRAHDLKRLATAEEERDLARIEEEVARVASKHLKTVQADMIADAFKPLLALANDIVGSILKTPLAYQGGEIGTWRSGGWVAHRVFSGSEKALAYAAIQAALASSSPAKIMVIDELGRLDDHNLGRLIRDIGMAIQGHALNQFIGVDVARAELVKTHSEFLDVELTTKMIG